MTTPIEAGAKAINPSAWETHESHQVEYMREKLRAMYLRETKAVFGSIDREGIAKVLYDQSTSKRKRRAGWECEGEWMRGLFLNAADAILAWLNGGTQC